MTEAESQMDLSSLPIDELAAELEARTACAPDLGITDAVCPACSSPSREVFGEYSCVERRFRCSSCGLNLWESQYEFALAGFYVTVSRTERETRELAAMRRAAR